MALVPSLDAILAGYVGLARQTVTFVLAAAVVYLLGRWLTVPAVQRAARRSRLNETARESLGGVLHIAVIVAAFLVGAAAGGFTQLFAGSALLVTAIGLAVGFAAQDALANFVSGIFIVGDPKLNVGDQIRWDGNEGRITSIRFRVTHVRTPDNETVIVPNNQLANAALVNETGNDPIGVSTEFGIGYDDDPERAAELIKEVARELDDTLDDRDPMARVLRLEDTSVILKARLWIAKADRQRRATVRAAFIRGVEERLDAEGIDLSTTSQHALSGAIAVEESGAA